MMSKNVTEIVMSAFLISGQLIEGLVKLVGDALVFLLLIDKLIFQPVDLFLELLNGPLCELSTGFSRLELVGKVLDLFLVGLLTLVSLFFRHFQGFEVVANNTKLFL